MEKSIFSKGLKDKHKRRIVVEEINRFNELVKGHKKILEAIGNL